MKRRINAICLWAGIVLLAAAVAVLALWQWGIGAAAQKAESYVEILRTLLPEQQTAAPEQRRDNTMPVLSVEGTDFVGILEMPRYGSSLPVGAQWGETSKYPCRLGGSVYDCTLQVGGTSQAGQYDFYQEISVGDAVYFTDMEGNRFSLVVTDIRYESHADQTALQRTDAALTLFIQNIYALEYIILSCNPAT